MEVELRLGDVNIVPQAYSDGIWYFIAKYKDKSIRFSIGEGILEPNKYSILGEQLGNVDDVLIFEYIKDDVRQFLKNPCMFYFRLFYQFVEGL